MYSESKKYVLLNVNPLLRSLSLRHFLASQIAVIAKPCFQQIVKRKILKKNPVPKYLIVFVATTALLLNLFPIFEVSHYRILI